MLKFKCKVYIFITHDIYYPTFSSILFSFGSRQWLSTTWFCKMVFKQCLKRNIIEFITFDKWQQQNQNGDGGCEVIHFEPHSSTKSCRFLLESIAPSVCCRLPSTTDCSRPGLWRDSPRPGSKEECQISTVREFKYWLIFEASVSLVFLLNADHYCKSQ